MDGESQVRRLIAQFNEADKKFSELQQIQFDAYHRRVAEHTADQVLEYLTKPRTAELAKDGGVSTDRTDATYKNRPPTPPTPVNPLEDYYEACHHGACSSYQEWHLHEWWWATEDEDVLNDEEQCHGATGTTTYTEEDTDQFHEHWCGISWKAPRIAIEPAQYRGWHEVHEDSWPAKYDLHADEHDADEHGVDGHDVAASRGHDVDSSRGQDPEADAARARAEWRQLNNKGKWAEGINGGKVRYRKRGGTRWKNGEQFPPHDAPKTVQLQ